MLDRVHKISDIIAAVAVVVTLIYVSVQASQNTAALKEANHQGHTSYAQELAVWLLDPAFADTVVRASKSSEGLTEIERMQYSEWIGGRLGLCESLFQTKTDGTLPEKLWIPWSNYCAHILSGVTAQEIWNDIKPHYESGFAEWLDESWSTSNG